MPIPTLQNALHASEQLLHEGSVGRALGYLSSHSGLPVTLVAAGLLVASFRVLRRVTTILLEIFLVMGALVLMTHLGWIAW